MNSDYHSDSESERDHSSDPDSISVSGSESDRTGSDFDDSEHSFSGSDWSGDSDEDAALPEETTSFSSSPTDVKATETPEKDVSQLVEVKKRLLLDLQMRYPEQFSGISADSLDLDAINGMIQKIQGNSTESEASASQYGGTRSIFAGARGLRVPAAPQPTQPGAVFSQPQPAQIRDYVPHQNPAELTEKSKWGLLLDEVNKNPIFINETGGTNGAPALSYAIFHRKIEMVEMLLSRQANPNIADNYGDTPMHYAIKFQMPDAVSALLQHGGTPSITARNVDRFTPIDMARHKKMDLNIYHLAEFALCSAAVERNHHVQVFYECFTCSLTQDKGICDACVARCHAGHNVRQMPLVEAFCDCDETRCCRAKTPIQPDARYTMPAFTPPPPPPVYPSAQIPTPTPTPATSSLEPILASLLLLQQKQMEIELARKKSESGSGKSKRSKADSSLFYTALYWVMLIGALSLALAFAFIFADTRNRAIQEARATALQEKSDAEAKYNSECIEKNLSWARAMLVSAYVRTPEGHLIGEALCEEYKRKMNIDPEEMAHADAATMARLFADSINVFVDTLSFKIKAFAVLSQLGPITEMVGKLVEFLPFGKIGTKLFDVFKVLTD